MQKFCFTCDLKNDPELIKEYKEYHKKGNVWKEVLESIKTSGVLNMEIYLIDTRMFMIIDADDTFSLKEKRLMDAENEQVQKWETMMNKFQKIPNFSNGEKWILMEKIFDLSEHG
ncbi:L-rhamnose mutarotase [Autumnicola musiva]|uniref:L-rhamnose mutarotase n=1 Tax=Autumnicola musiva TaxID=3075589 RepID=A0ABU3D7P8_9FLAO|nr:L-rhamnose mutarotase [Zunongwangia sp. F117]MDT0677557.1 L-rhamnose mutarotase [Zunongwangia sp. F117]